MTFVAKDQPCYGVSDQTTQTTLDKNSTAWILPHSFITIQLATTVQTSFLTIFIGNNTLEDLFPSFPFFLLLRRLLLLLLLCSPAAWSVPHCPFCPLQAGPGRTRRRWREGEVEKMKKKKKKKKSKSLILILHTLWIWHARMIRAKSFRGVDLFFSS